MNIKVNYLYRDAANYKQYNSEIFSNKHKIDLDKIELLITSSLHEECWFSPQQWHLKDLHFDQWDNSLDHDWHEFESVELTTTSCTKEDILDFLLLIHHFL